MAIGIDANHEDLAAGTPDPARRLLLLGIVLAPLAGCGGSPMRVEQRYREPKTEAELLDEKAAAARATVRSQGEGPGSF